MLSRSWLEQSSTTTIYYFLGLGRWVAGRWCYCLLTVMGFRYRAGYYNTHTAVLTKTFLLPVSTQQRRWSVPFNLEHMNSGAALMRVTSTRTAQTLIIALVSCGMSTLTPQRVLGFRRSIAGNCTLTWIVNKFRW
ncbi:MAG: hypothetical protein AVDCRST_MAG93-5399 [uncultured Chloroflexia bacterium]|uniref:Uncharacterized protein n=1 Tax=uncultured Chloroflexia bacterium TaxID=1672391 RepID=A0A6J4KTD2_9CHLR|nr:MAG: hypothetical protein AVDCRST_MAG93-5399 [uncultured Chloroflexia bacterium]